MGTPAFALPSLAALLEAGHEVAAVYTQPPRPRGRGQRLAPSPVGAFAAERGLQVRAPESMKAADAVAGLGALDADAAVVVAYGQILLPAVLEAPRLGAFNLHGSLLPRWRGAAPIQRALMAGDAETGVQVMRMSAGLDEGAVLATARTPIGPDDTAATLADRLATLGAALWRPTLEAVAAGRAVEVEQSGEPVYAKKIRPAEARIDWTRSAVELDRHVRGLSPAPGAWFEAPDRHGGPPGRVKALLSRPTEGSGAPGEVLADREGGLVVATGEGALRLLRGQREGRGAQDAADLLRGLPLPPGTRLA